MEQDFRNQADGFAGAAEPEAHALPLSEQRPAVRYCTWCKEICIRPKAVPAKEGLQDALIVFIYGDERKVYWNGHEVLIGDGICEICRAREYPESRKAKKS